MSLLALPAMARCSPSAARMHANLTGLTKPVQGLLAGKLAVVTGASRGIGQAIAEAFAAESANLVLTAEAGQEEEFKKVLHTWPGQAFVFIAAYNHTRTRVIKPVVGLPWLVACFGVTIPQLAAPYSLPLHNAMQNASAL